MRAHTYIYIHVYIHIYCLLLVVRRGPLRPLDAGRGEQRAPGLLRGVPYIFIISKYFKMFNFYSIYVKMFDFLLSIRWNIIRYTKMSLYIWTYIPCFCEAIHSNNSYSINNNNNSYSMNSNNNNNNNNIYIYIYIMLFLIIAIWASARRSPRRSSRTSAGSHGRHDI